MTQAHIEAEKTRIRKLLSQKRTGLDLQDVPANPTADAVGALAALGLQTDDGEVRANVYIYEDWGDGEAYIEQLEAQFPSSEAQYTNAGINGVLLFFGIAKMDGVLGRKAEDMLDEMLSAFSGNE